MHTSILGSCLNICLCVIHGVFLKKGLLCTLPKKYQRGSLLLHLDCLIFIEKMSNKMSQNLLRTPWLHVYLLHYI